MFDRKTCLSVIIDRCLNFLVRYLFLYLNDIIYRYTMKRLRKMKEREDWNKKYFNIHSRLIRKILRYNRQIFICERSTITENTKD